TLIDNDIKLYHPLEIVSFTAEEANDFNLSTMGSRAFSGKLNRNTLLNATDSTGRTLKEAVKYVGSDVSQVSKTKKDIAAFIELHIEQGIRLEKANHSIGIVDSIVGIQQEKVTIYGEANHSGTTMMEDRADALVTASEIVIAIEAILQRSRTNAVATVGRFNVSPNASNVIPGQVELIFEIRSQSKRERNILHKEIMGEIETVIKKRDCTVKTEKILDKSECLFDKDIIKSLAKTADKMKIPYTFLPSMAGHDARQIADLTKTAMLFVKSINGISHSPEEFSKEEDIEIATNLLLNTVLSLDKQL